MQGSPTPAELQSRIILFWNASTAAPGAGAWPKRRRANTRTRLDSTQLGPSHVQRSPNITPHYSPFTTPHDARPSTVCVRPLNPVDHKHHALISPKIQCASITPPGHVESSHSGHAPGARCRVAQAPAAQPLFSVGDRRRGGRSITFGRALPSRILRLAPYHAALSLSL